MGEIYVSRDERDRIKAVDLDVLRQSLEQCMRGKRSGPLRGLGLEYCGPYISSTLRQYESSLVEYGNAKAPKKRREAESRASRAGYDLVSAVQQMKSRVDEEEAETERFRVEDLVIPPGRLDERLTVRVSYHWRAKREDPWTYGSITFFHEVSTRPDYSAPLPKRKPSAWKLERDLQDKLYREWEHLLSLALHAVRDYFRDGGTPTGIPEKFQAIPDSRGHGLNNFSARFWK